MTLSYQETDLLVMTLTFCLLFLPYMAYIFYVYHELRTEAESTRNSYAKRIPALILLQCILQIFTTAQTAFIDQDHCYGAYCENLPTSIHKMLQFWAISPMVFVMLFRSYFVLYKTKHTHIVTNSEWWQHVNADFDPNSNWYIKHKNNFGSFHFMWKWLLSFVLLIGTYN